jgi:2-aminoethylphosphonate-pyruvate transaminase
LNIGRDKRLFTPGPLTTSAGVKRAMLRDLGSRDAEFLTVVKRIREALLTTAGLTAGGAYEAVLIPGSGTYGVESVLGSAVPTDGRLLVLANGAYGERMATIAGRLRLAHEVLRFPEERPIEPAAVDGALARGFSHVALVHCETSSGLLNPVDAVGDVATRRGSRLLVDAMSSFGAVPLDLAGSAVDFLVSSSNKCLEGVPGCAFVLARRQALLATEGHARSLSLDLFDQWRGLETNGQFRFTPPVQVLLALDQALAELHDEGGVGARGRRYRANQRCLVEGMRALGFLPFLPEEHQGPIITAFRYPRDPRFDFEEFYGRLSAEGMLIYPAKLLAADCFRIGTIGRLFTSDVRLLLDAVGLVARAMDLAPS